MSRIGKLPIKIPAGVTITIDQDNINVTGPKGSLSQFMMPGITVSQKEGEILITRINDEPQNRLSIS